MKFLTDENISPVILFELRKLQHNVIDIKEKDLRGISDNEIAKIAVRENRIIITHDTTFLQSIDPDLKVRILLISFKPNQATREKMKLVGWYIAEKIQEVIGKKSKLHLKVGSETLNIYPLE